VKGDGAALSSPTATAAAAAAAADSSVRDLPGMNLLKQLVVGPVFKVQENPVAEQLAQLVVPEPHVAYGGQLGQWGADASPKDRLGHIIVPSDSRRVSRAILRVHLHTIHVHSHPSMSIEERLFVTLRTTYSKYAAVFEQRATGYLTYRLMALVLEIKRLSSMIAAADKDVGRSDAGNKENNSPPLETPSDHVIALTRLFEDLVETLPALLQIRVALDSLAASLYQSWRDLLEIRQRQGFSSTTAVLVARRIRGAGKASVVDTAADAVNLNEEKLARDTSG
jgi:hypothetical protein